MRRIVLLALVLALIYPVTTYVRALTYPGTASFAVRTTDWLRDDMGAGGIVTTIENWYYTRKTPSNAPPAADSLPRAATHVDPTGTRTADLDVPRGLLGEGRWVPGTVDANGRGVLYTTFVRPDAAHGGVVAAAAWLNQKLTTAKAVAGTKEPNRDPNRAARVPTSMRSRLMVDFNSGFKMVDANGGAYLDRRPVAPLRDGAASVVIHAGGRVSVDQWGRDTRMSSDVVSVVQSLDLVVDHGRVVAGLGTNRDARWGSARSQFQYTWRSGLGTDSGGNLIYVAGNELTLATLAHAMHEAGIVRGMQLDIHPGMVSFNYFPRPAASPTKLLPTLSSPPDRYLSTDLRAFFAVALRTDQERGKP